MIVSQDNQRLYPASWEYNAARVLTRLALVIQNHGGRVQPLHPALISNRSITAEMAESLDKIERVKLVAGENHREERAAYIKHLEDRVAELKAIDNSPIKVTHMSYIRFVLGDIMYYYQIDQNPFFPFYYSKTPVVAGQYDRYAICEEDESKEWVFDSMFSAKASEDDVKEAAELIFNKLLLARCSKSERRTRQIRVPNSYDGGWHMERIAEPLNLVSVDF